MDEKVLADRDPSLSPVCTSHTMKDEPQQEDLSGWILIAPCLRNFLFAVTWISPLAMDATMANAQTPSFQTGWVRIPWLRVYLWISWFFLLQFLLFDKLESRETSGNDNSICVDLLRAIAMLHLLFICRVICVKFSFWVRILKNWWVSSKSIINNYYNFHRINTSIIILIFILWQENILNKS